MLAPTAGTRARGRCGRCSQAPTWRHVIKGACRQSGPSSLSSTRALKPCCHVGVVEQLLLQPVDPVHTCASERSRQMERQILGTCSCCKLLACYIYSRLHIGKSSERGRTGLGDAPFAREARPESALLQIEVHAVADIVRVPGSGYRPLCACKVGRARCRRRHAPSTHPHVCSRRSVLAAQTTRHQMPLRVKGCSVSPF